MVFFPHCKVITTNIAVIYKDNQLVTNHNSTTRLYKDPYYCTQIIKGNLKKTAEMNFAFIIIFA